MPRLVIAAVIALLPLCGTADATVVSGTFSGTIAGNTLDTYGPFGAAGAALSGMTITASYSYDTAAAFSYNMQPDQDAYLGSNNLTLSVTIGSVTVAASGVTESEVTDAGDGSLTAVTLVNYRPTPLIKFALVAVGSWTAGVTINAPFVLDPSTWQQTIYVSADGIRYDQLNFVALPDSPTPAPEPGTLALAAMAALPGLAILRRGRRPGSSVRQDPVARGLSAASVGRSASGNRPCPHRNRVGRAAARASPAEAGEAGSVTTPGGRRWRRRSPPPSGCRSGRPGASPGCRWCCRSSSAPAPRHSRTPPGWRTRRHRCPPRPAC